MVQVWRNLREILRRLPTVAAPEAPVAAAAVEALGRAAVDEALRLRQMGREQGADM